MLQNWGKISLLPSSLVTVSFEQNFYGHPNLFMFFETQILMKELVVVISVAIGIVDGCDTITF